MKRTIIYISDIQKKYQSLKFNPFITFIAFSILIFNTSCHKDKNVQPAGALINGFQEVRLVADSAGLRADRIDTNLVNPWGIAVGATGNVWISANQSGLSVVYDINGDQQLPPVAIPSHGDHFGGSPTGVVYNTTNDFVIPSNGQAAKFIFAGEDGTISAWSSGESAITVVDHSASNAVYKGIALAADGGSTFLYLANFKGQKIDVYDNAFNYVTSKPFNDPNIPAGFGPFNIQNINGNLFVTYAKLLAPDNEDDEKGPGNGYVNVFSPDGTFLKRFASNGVLNSPWGIALSPNTNFGSFTNSIMIGNFGDGRINVYDTNGGFMGQLQDGNNNPIAIDGLWALTFQNNNLLFFTAGPDDEQHGIFGYIKP